MEDLINKTSSLHCADLDDLIADETSASKEYELTLLAKIISSKQPNPKVVHSILRKAWNPSKEGNLAWLRFLRIQVQIDINKPLHTGFYRNKDPNQAVWIRVQYECLPDFCFSCGRLGHTNRGYSHPPFEPPKNMSSPYGPWLRAESPDTCPRTASWNPLAVIIRAKTTSCISDLPEQIASDLPESSMPDVPGAILGIHPPPKALTPAPFDQTFDMTKQPRTEIRDSVSNQTPPFFPHFKARISNENN
ncbi:hypothetical protein RJ639_039459 [Escallonia herrerae]|uniref:Zinc knuckle CX2CX4HX4C domain-containing protein n=1 Tax=Escallonia herrerae TaxID=1293975 RepID=A0AA88WMM8_9ASTE|nr:hypothetical protein RJ639_039459 [Escallonia herrerae]